MMSVEDMQILTDFLQTKISEDHPFCVLSGDKLNGDKDNRKNFHSYIRAEFGNFLVTDTFEESASKRSLRVWIKKFQTAEQVKYKKEYLDARSLGVGERDNRGRKKFKPNNINTASLSVGVMMKDPWPVNQPNYLHFRVYKENRDTAESIQSIARCLCIPPKSFQFSGTKDRRGITVQGVSVYRISIEAMKKALLHSSWDNTIRISHLEYKDEPLKIGGNSGNHFKIALRSIQPNFDITQIHALFTQLKENGFLNYYGLQRFGNRTVRTHHVGALLLLGEFKQVVDLLLGHADVEDSTDTARTAWMSHYLKGDVETAHTECPSYLYIEKALLRALHMSGQQTNYLNAIQSLPSTTTHMYLHSVQSFAFNAALSHRITKLGQSVIIGDLVVSNKNIQKVESVIVIQTIEQAKEYTLSDTVQTLVGSDVIIPPNMKEFYHDFFRNKFGITIDSIVNSTLPKFLHLRGAYRRIISHAENLVWKIHQNVSNSDILIQSDLDLLRPSDPPTPDVEPREEYTAVTFECSLNSGCYLTMALREVSQVSEHR